MCCSISLHTKRSAHPFTGRTFRCACSGPLVEHLLAQHGEQVLVAAVPVHEHNTSRQVDSLPSPEDVEDVKPKEIATAARVLQVSRNTQVYVLTCPMPALANSGVLRSCLECRLVRGLWCWRAGVESTSRPHPNNTNLAIWSSMWSKLGRPRKPGVYLDLKQWYHTCNCTRLTCINAQPTNAVSQLLHDTCWNVQQLMKPLQI